MKVENQVTSLEISKQLKELGVEQKSLFYLSIFPKESAAFYLWGEQIIDQNNKMADEKRTFSAYTVSELLYMLPTKLNCVVMKNHLSNSEWIGFDHNQPERWMINAETAADAAGKIVIYAYKNKLC